MCHKPLAKPPLIVSGILRASREQTFVRIAASVNMGSLKPFAAICANGCFDAAAVH